MIFCYMTEPPLSPAVLFQNRTACSAFPKTKTTEMPFRLVAHPAEALGLKPLSGIKKKKKFTVNIKLYIIVAYCHKYKITTTNGMMFYFPDFIFILDAQTNFKF